MYPAHQLRLPPRFYGRLRHLDYSNTWITDCYFSPVRIGVASLTLRISSTKDTKEERGPVQQKETDASSSEGIDHGLAA